MLLAIFATGSPSTVWCWAGVHFASEKPFERGPNNRLHVGEGAADVHEGTKIGLFFLERRDECLCSDLCKGDALPETARRIERFVSGWNRSMMQPMS